MGLIGYARISTIEGAQVLDRQLDALHAAGCERVFEDRASGIRADRPGLVACLDVLRKGDVLVELGLDRLGWLAGELIAPIDRLKWCGVAFRALNAPMDTTTPTGRDQAFNPLPLPALYHYLPADGSLRTPARDLLENTGKEERAA